MVSIEAGKLLLLCWSDCDDALVHAGDERVELVRIQQRIFARSLVPNMSTTFLVDRVVNLIHIRA